MKTSSRLNSSRKRWTSKGEKEKTENEREQFRRFLTMRWLRLLMYKWLFTWTIYFSFSTFSTCSFSHIFSLDSLLWWIQRFFMFRLVVFLKLPQFTTRPGKSERFSVNSSTYAGIENRTPILVNPLSVSWIFLMQLKISFLRKFWKVFSQNSPIVFGSIWYAGMPQCAGGGVVRWSPLWQKNGVNPILFAYKKQEEKC